MTARTIFDASFASRAGDCLGIAVELAGAAP
jgi:hypothetical protein